MPNSPIDQTPRTSSPTHPAAQPAIVPGPDRSGRRRRRQRDERHRPQPARRRPRRRARSPARQTPPPRGRAAVAFLQSATDAYPTLNTGPRLPQSYADELGLFSTAFVYDSALAVIALLADGRRSAEQTARTIGDGLVYAQEHDPGYSDGRLRQGYNVGPYTFYDGNPQPYGFVLPDGTANIGWQFGFLGTAVGDMAWPGIALGQLFARTRDRRYLDAAVRIGTWITTNTWSTQPLGGFSFGVNGAERAGAERLDRAQHRLRRVLHDAPRAARSRSWSKAADHARAFVDLMWDPAQGAFWTGTNDGVEINRSRAARPATWSWLALREKRVRRQRSTGPGRRSPSPTTRALPTSQLPDGRTALRRHVQHREPHVDRAVQRHHRAPAGRLARGHQPARDRAGRPSRRGRQARCRRAARAGPARAGRARRRSAALGGVEVDGGIVAASSLLDTGFGFGYFQVQHVGATSWFVFGETRANPLRLLRGAEPRTTYVRSVHGRQVERPSVRANATARASGAIAAWASGPIVRTVTASDATASCDERRTRTGDDEPAATSRPVAAKAPVTASCAAGAAADATGTTAAGAAATAGLPGASTCSSPGTVRRAA